MPGYNGANCSISCPYPYFGNQCQQMCTCIKDLCDDTSGCQHVNRGTFTLEHFLFRQLICVNDSLELTSVLDHILNCIKHFNDSDSL